MFTLGMSQTRLVTVTLGFAVNVTGCPTKISPVGALISTVGAAVDALIFVLLFSRCSTFEFVALRIAIGA